MKARSRKRRSERSAIGSPAVGPPDLEAKDRGRIDCALRERVLLVGRDAPGLDRERAILRYIQNRVVERVGRIEVGGRGRDRRIRVTLTEDLPQPREVRR